MLSVKKKSVEKYLYPLADLLKNVNPNTLTLIGSIPSLLFFVFVVNHMYIWALIAFIGNGFDFIDGMVARKYNKVTAFGGFLDSTLDRIADFLMISSFAFAGIVRWEIVAPLLLFSFLISYTRSRGELANPAISFAVGIIERTERLIAIISAVIFYMLFPTINILSFNIAETILIILGALSFYTFLQRIMHAYKKL